MTYFVGKRGLSVAVALGLGSLAWANTQPYAGQNAREIASLSPQDIEALSLGRGWGFAKAAELNGFPGPAHILELAETLALTDAQVTAVQEIFDRMNAEARLTGTAFIEAETALDAAFEDGSVTPEALAELTAQSGALRAKLRALHLSAHLEAKPLLTRHQIMMYNTARGYVDGAGHAGHDDH